MKAPTEKPRLRERSYRLFLTLECDERKQRAGLIALGGVDFIVLLLVAVLVVPGCSTDSYYKDNNSTLVTVKRFVGIPYLEKEEHVRRRPMGSESVPVQ
jgi:hypothetical protein